MFITADRFKEAAKAYHGTRPESSLAEAREDFARFFRFRNYDHALKALAPREAAALSRSAPAAAGAVEEVPLWKGLTPREVFRLVELLIRSQGVDRSSEGLNWLRKAANLIEALLVSMAASGEPFSVDAIVDAMSLDAIGRRYMRLLREHGEGHWPFAHRGLRQYLEVGCPGFSVDKLKMAHGHPVADAPAQGTNLPGKSRRQSTNQDSIAYEQHAYRTSEFVPILHALARIEMSDIDSICLVNGTRLVDLVRDRHANVITMEIDLQLRALTDELREQLLFSGAAPRAATGPESSRAADIADDDSDEPWTVDGEQAKRQLIFGSSGVPRKASSTGDAG